MKTRVTIAMLLLSGLVLTPRAHAFPAAPTLTDVNYSVVSLGGNDYYDVTATMHGTVLADPNPYAVPVTFLYPVDPAVCNGTGIVDLLNNSAMVLTRIQGVFPLPAARRRLTDEFIGAKRYFYAGVQWERARGAIALFNQLYGTSYVIPTDAHQFGIILDGSTALRSPPQGLPGSPCPVDTVAGYGMSASTVPLNALKQVALSGPVFSSAFAALYDGIIWDSITAGFLPPTVPIAMTGVKTINISAQTDVELFANHLKVRGENPEFRSYEVAGGTHVSRDEHNLEEIGALLPSPPSPPTRQNLVTHSPVFRAMMEHLRAWMTEGIPPPPSVFFDGSNYPFLPISCVGLPIPGIANVPRGPDGNVLGGVRLPYLQTVVDGKTIGSPLGQYNGIELQYGCSAGGFPQVAIVTGNFIRNDALIGGYKNHGDYVSGVSQAAQYAFEKGWILQEDVEAYSSAAAHCVVGHAAPADITLDDLTACYE